MSSIEEDVFSALTSGSPSALRVYPDTLPQMPVLPAMTYSIIAGEDDFDLEGPTELIRRLVQVDAWATTRSSVTSMMEEAKTLMLLSTEFTVNAINVAGAPGYEPDTKLYRSSYEFILWKNQ